MRIYDAVKHNLINEGFDDTILHLKISEAVRDNKLINIEALTACCKVPSEATYIINAIKNGPYAIYYGDGKRAEFDDVKEDEVAPAIVPKEDIANFPNEDLAYEWAKEVLQENGKLEYAFANDKLGYHRKNVYARLVANSLGSITPDGIVKSTGPAKTWRQCPKCSEYKPDFEFPQGRNVCRECYNASRRSALGNVRGHSRSERVDKLIKDYFKEEKELMRQFRYDLKDLQVDFKEELQAILNDNDNE